MSPDYVGQEHVDEYINDAQALVSTLRDMGLDNAAIAASLNKQSFQERVNYNTTGTRLALAMAVALQKVAAELS